MNRPGDAPDLILLSRRCYTLAADGRPPEALALKGGRILAVGTRRTVRRLRGRGTRVLDLGSAVITPGFWDCHTHFAYWALNRQLVSDVSAAPTLDAVLRKIRARAEQTPAGEWVLGRGFDHNRWGGVFPQAADLDRAAPRHPVVVRSRDGHSACLNTLALRRAGIMRATPDPPGGRYLRNARGAPTGVVQESAVDQLPDPVRDFARRGDATAQRIVDRALNAAYRTAWSFGIVGIHSMDDGASLSHLLRQRGERRLGVRVVHAVALADLPHALTIGLRSGCGDDWLRVGGVKIFADGALGSQTAYMFAPYPGRGDYCGVPVIAGAELKEAVIATARRGWAAWIHAIGDRAVHDAVAAIATACRAGTPALPHRIEHAQCVRPTDVRRMGQARIVASVQPCHILGDIAIADRHWPRARAHAYPLRRMLDAGVTLAAGSDVPVESLDPRRSLFAATMRTDERGEPAGGWFPQQRLTTEEVLRAFTRDAAAAVGKRAPAGTLAPGAPADLTIWTEDPLACPRERLLEIGILGCVIDGQVHLGSAVRA